VSAKHTPGPWLTTDGIYNEIKALSEPGKTWVIARIKAASGVHEEARANAKLIAAAPDLLEVLQDVAADTGPSGWWWGEKMMAAIAKAKGEAQ
jgi:hypothetical protein